jgi:peptide/nickel transport system permease protein
MSLQESQLESLETASLADSSGGQTVAGLSPSQLAVRRFRKDKLSMVSFIVVALYLIAAVAAPFLVKFGVLDYQTYHNSPKLLNIPLGGIPRGHLGGVSWSHPLGIEPGTGRDVMSRLWYGVTFSLVIALTATLIAVAVGTVLGIVSGFSGGKVDAVIGRVIDLTLSFPQTLMLLALSGLMIDVLTQKAHVPAGDMANGLYVILVLAVFGWPGVARLIRGQVLSIREREFIDAARLLGASRRRLYFKEVLPNLWAPVLVSFTLTMPAYISAEAALSYLSVGIKPPTPTLGNILKSSISYSSADFAFFFFPAFLIAIIVVSFNLLGDGIRDALDPKSDR